MAKLSGVVQTEHEERTREVGRRLAIHAFQGVLGLTVVDVLSCHSGGSASLNRMAIETRFAYRGEFTGHSKADRRTPPQPEEILSRSRGGFDGVYCNRGGEFGSRNADRRA